MSSLKPGILRYNQLVRILLLSLLLIAWPLAAWAGDSCRCDDGCSPDAMISAAVDDCCKLITIACIRVKYTPRCDWPEHQCPVPYTPCDCGKCIEAPCHKPVVPCAPCGSYCIEAACHMPVVAVYPADAGVCCAADPCACEE
jgi:hypothetical protein